MKVENIYSVLSILKIVARLEGVSYLLLLCLAMPLKYWANTPQFVQVIGMIHGLLFVGYLMMVINAHVFYHWKWTKTFWVAIASLFPFAPFYVDKKMLIAE